MKKIILKYVFILLLFSSIFKVWSQDFEAEIIIPDNSTAKNFIFVQLGTMLQIDNSPRVRIPGNLFDRHEMLNSQWVFYNIKIRLYRKVFFNFKHGFSWDHIGYAELDNRNAYSIAMSDFKTLFVRGSFSLEYFFIYKHNLFNISMGLQNSSANVDLLYYVYSEYFHDYVPILNQGYNYSTYFAALGYNYRNLQFLVAYHFGEFEDKLSLFTFSISYNVLGK